MPDTDLIERHDRELSALRENVARQERAWDHIETRIPEKLGETLVGISVKLDHAIGDIGSLKTLIREDFVSRHEFDPVKKVVYGMVGLVLTAVLAALIALVVMR